MKQLCLILFIISLLISAGSGCGPSYRHHVDYKEEYLTPNQVELRPYGTILESSYQAGDILAMNLQKRKVDPQRPILAASFVSTDNLEMSSSFGRLVAEQISSRLAQHGLNMKEIKLRKDTVFIQQKKGEFMLSRRLKELGVDYDAESALVGTYAVTPLRIFVTARIVRAEDNTVIASHDYSIVQNAISRDLVQ